MPKEFTHIIVSGKALEKVERLSPEAGRSLRDNYSIFMLGSILCDSAFYDLRGRVASLSENIHTIRGDIDRNFFRSLATLPRPEDGDAYFAFLCGILSHHLADRSMHPFIVHFTGDYKDPDPERRRWSQARHRFLEGLIDIWVTKRMGSGDIDNFRLENYIILDLPHLYPYLSMFVSASAGQDKGVNLRSAATGIYKALRFESMLIGLYGNKNCRRFMLAVNRLAGHRLSHYAALLYACNAPSISILTGPAPSAKPFSGEESKEELGTIVSELIDTLSSAILKGYNTFRASELLFPDEDTLFYLDTAMSSSPEVFDTAEVDGALRDFLGMRRR